MADHPTHFRVFLGSPGDLPDERELAPKVIAAINRELGEVFNCHIDLTKWEDTPPASEEPQDYINRLLNKCDIFVGMLHQKWGMPTSHYTSGFLEEYELCRTRRINEGKPEILLFFKEIELPEWQRADPHPDIKKVLEFKERVMNVDKFKYVPFEHPAGFGERLRAVT